MNTHQLLCSLSTVWEWEQPGSLEMCVDLTQNFLAWFPDLCVQSCCSSQWQRRYFSNIFVKCQSVGKWQQSHIIISAWDIFVKLQVWHMFLFTNVFSLVWSFQIGRGEETEDWRPGDLTWCLLHQANNWKCLWNHRSDSCSGKQPGTAGLWWAVENKSSITTNLEFHVVACIWEVAAVVLVVIWLY